MRTIPTIIELRQKLSDDLKSKLDLNDVELKLVLDALTNTLAGQLKLVYLYISDVRRNIFPDTADTVEQGGELNRWGNIQLNRQPKPATDGFYIVSLVGVAGSQIRSGLTFKSDENSKSPSKLFISDDSYELTGANDTITIRSLESGLESALEVGDILGITEPVVGVEQEVSVSSITELPISKEDTESYRKAIIDSIQLEPQGGSKTDIRLWSADAQGVRRVYPYVKENEAGVTQVYVEANELDSTDGNGTPTQAIMDLVSDVIELDPDETKPIHERGRRPIQTILEVLPIVPTPVDVEIIGLQSTSTSIEDLIEYNLKIFLNDVRPFIAGAELLRNKNDILTASKLQVAVSESIGVNNSFQEFRMSVNSQEEITFTFNTASIPYLRNVTYS